MFMYKNNLFAYRLAYPLLLSTLLMTVMVISVPKVRAENTTPSMLVYKSPTCGCCTAWIDHMNKAGFNTAFRHPKNLNEIKKQLRISAENQACHTSTSQGYAFEGHIPGAVIQQFLIDKPANSLGLAVPGMPMGSPGMDTAKHFNPYQVYRLNTDGSRTPYAEISTSGTTFLGSKS